jgi:PAS domain S-box-containing protein
MTKRAEKRLPKLLKVYEDSDFDIRERAIFFYYLMIIMSVSMIVVIPYSAIVQLIGPDFGHFYFPVLLSEVVILLIILFSLFLLIKGKYRLSTHMLAITSISAIWIIMFLDKSSAVVRFDTIVYIFGVLSMLPLILQRGRLAMQMYAGANLLLLILFILIAGKQMNLPASVKLEYFFDVLVSTTFVIIVGYNIYNINRRAHKRAIIDIKQRHEAEKALLESEKKYNDTIELLPQTIYEADVDGKLKYVNEIGYRSFGYTPEDLLNGVNIIEMIHESSRELVRRNIAKIISGDLVNGNIYTALRKDGTTFPVQIYSGVKTVNDQVTGLRGIIVDISERTRAESEIKKSRDQFESLVSNIPGITYRCLFDKDRTVLFLNKEFEKISGYRIEDFVNSNTKTLESLIFNDDRESVASVINTSVENEMPWEIEYRIIQKGGAVRWVYEKGRAVFSSPGTVEFIDGFILDISERKLMDTLLKESEERYRNLFENAQIGIYQTTPDGSILNANPAIIRMLGFESIDELKKINLETGQEYSDYGRPKFKALIEKNHVIHNFESRWRKKNGESIDIIENAQAVMDPDGKILYYDGFVENITDRKKAEKALIESQQQFQILSEMSPVGIFRTSKNGSTTYVNPKWSEISGLNIDEASGDGWINAVHPEDRIKLMNTWEEGFNHGEKSIAEYRFIKPDGNINWVLGNAVPEIIDGEVKGYIGTITNITDIKNTLSMLEKSERRFRDLADLLPQTVWEATTEGILTFINKHGLMLYGYTADDLASGLTLFNFVIPGEKEKALLSIQRIISKEEAVILGEEYTSVKRDGSTFPIRPYFSAIFENGKPVGLRGVTFDISDIKQAENELIESEGRYRSIIESFPDLIMISDFNGNIIYGNEPLQRTTGLEEEDYRNLNRKPHIHPDDAQMVVSAIRDLIATGKRHTEIIENRFIDKWDKVHWLSGIISLIVLNGQTMLQTITRDITEKKTIELELDQYRNKLELLVLERTAELGTANEELVKINETLVDQHKELEAMLVNLKLAQSQLIQSEKMASLGILAAGVAHEINNPLNFIKGGIIAIESYLKENFEDNLTEIEPLLNSINEGVQRASIIVTSLNHYNRYDEIPMTRCNIHLIIDNCLVMLQNNTRHRITVNREYTGKEYELICNEGRMHQAFLNILANAVQSIKNEGKISIKTSITGETFQISISDNGCGITEKNVARIFDPFFTTKDPGMGIGLGLSITYNIINEHNGSIICNSILNEGTEFIVTLPAKF